MRSEGLEFLVERWSHVEELADRTPGADPWCSGPDWVMSAHGAFAPTNEPWILTNLAPAPESTAAGPETGCLLLSRYQLSDVGPDNPRAPSQHRDASPTRGLAGLEPIWGFANPVLGANPPAVLAAAMPVLLADDGWDVLLLPGQAAPWGDGATDQAQLQLDPTSPTMQLAATLMEFSSGSSATRNPGPSGGVGIGEGITRQVADLSEGFEPWWQRRSARFRRNLRKARTAAAELGLEIVELDRHRNGRTAVGHSPDEDFDRLLRVEQRSWKGLEASGITAADMGTFYRLLLPRLQERHRFRGWVARLDNRDVGFIIGGIRNRRYRGLQLSYVADAAHLSIGNLLQLHQIEQLCYEDTADTYDLGLDFEYKRRWADRTETSVTLVFRR